MHVKALQSVDPVDAAHEAELAFGRDAILHEHGGRYFAFFDTSASHRGGNAAPVLDAPVLALAAVLGRHRVPPALAEQLEQAAEGIAQCETALALALGKALRFGPMPRRVLAIGAPASGKTTLLAKLASRPRREPVRVSWTPGVDPGALIAYAAALGLTAVPLAESVVDETEIALVEAPGLPVGRLRRNSTAILDAARDAARAASLCPVLVMPAESGTAEAAELAAAAVEAGIEHLAITRLDQAKHLGTVLAAAAIGGLQLTTVSINPHMAYGLRALTPAVLTRLMIEGKGVGMHLNEVDEGAGTAHAYLQSVY